MYMPSQEQHWRGYTRRCAYGVAKLQVHGRARGYARLSDSDYGRRKAGGEAKGRSSEDGLVVQHCDWVDDGELQMKPDGLGLKTRV